jgi:hypothetical protein
MSQALIMILNGSLGEQLFQYAAGRALSYVLGGKLYLSEPNGTDYRPVLFVKSLPPPPFKATNIYRQISATEPWTPERFSGMDILYCQGQFQYLPALQNILPFLKQELLTSLYPIRQQLITKYNLQMRKRAAFIYVTRDKPQDYYESLMANMTSKKSIHVYILSDDLDWCKTLPWLHGHTLVNEPELPSLAFMSLCEAGGNGNTPLSWWGSFLSSILPVNGPPV